jgi:integrase
MVGKCLTQIRAVFESAIDDDLIERNPALKITTPPTKRPSERFLELTECRRLLEVASPQDNIILRLFMVIGFRPGELFALRVNDVQPGKIRIDQTVVDYKLKDGAKTEGSVGDVPLPPELEAALREYIRAEGITDLLFPSTTGTPISPDNYLDRTLKHLGILAGIDVFTEADGTLNSKLNHQVLRRTTGTHFQKHGEIKDTQALLRHADASTTLEHYQKKLDQSLISGVDSWDAELVPRKGPGSEEAKRKVN